MNLMGKQPSLLERAVTGIRNITDGGADRAFKKHMPRMYAAAERGSIAFDRLGDRLFDPAGYSAGLRAQMGPRYRPEMQFSPGVNAMLGNMGWNRSGARMGPMGNMGWDRSGRRMGTSDGTTPVMAEWDPGTAMIVHPTHSNAARAATGTGFTLPNRPRGEMILHPTESNAAKATVSNTSAQNQAQFTPHAVSSSGMMTALGVGAGGLVGGIASYATGGEFGQGFAMGMGGAIGGKALKRAAMNNMAQQGGLTMTKKYAGMGGAKETAASALNAAATSLQTARTRTTMMSGAGLAGAMFGGDRSSHSRGFNQSRGNRF